MARLGHLVGLGEGRQRSAGGCGAGIGSLPLDVAGPWMPSRVNHASVTPALTPFVSLVARASLVDPGSRRATQALGTRRGCPVKHEQPTMLPHPGAVDFRQRQLRDPVCPRGYRLVPQSRLRTPKLNQKLLTLPGWARTIQTGRMAPHCHRQTGVQAKKGRGTNENDARVH